MNRKQQQIRPPDRALWSYGMLLDWHLQRWKQRGSGKLDSFARDIGRTVRVLYDYQRDRSWPDGNTHAKIEGRLFDTEPSDAKLAEWKEELRRAHDKMNIEALTTPPISSVVRGDVDRPVPPKLYLREDALHPDTFHRDGHYATSDISCSSQRDGPNDRLPVWLSASYPPVEPHRVSLKTALIEIDLPDGVEPSDILGHPSAVVLETGIAVAYRGKVGRTRRWELIPPSGAKTLHGLNALAENPPLAQLQRAKCEQTMEHRMVARANMDFHFEIDPPTEGTPSDAAAKVKTARLKQKIIERLEFKEQIGDASETGLILLVRTHNFVDEA